jgi:hypothetical protein
MSAGHTYVGVDDGNYIPFEHGYVSADLPRVLGKEKVHIWIKFKDTATISKIMVHDSESGESLSTSPNEIETKYLDICFY